MEQAVTRNRAYARASGLGAAWAALALGLLYAAASLYWGLGGSWLRYGRWPASKPRS
jgi:hypothetical protein